MAHVTYAIEIASHYEAATDMSAPRHIREEVEICRILHLTSTLDPIWRHTRWWWR